MELCKLEARHVFNREEKNKLLFSDIKVEPSHSAFIKKRLDISLCSPSYDGLIEDIKEQQICMEGFKVEYLVLDGDTTSYEERLSKLRDIGYSIDGTPDYYNPAITYGLSYYNGEWYFGVLNKNNLDWNKHKNKPCSFSNSLNINLAKALVNISSKGNSGKKLIDACCGVGTVMLEACFAGYSIEGCDINWKSCVHTRKNLAFYSYKAEVYRSDIKDITASYDAAIVDLPYNLYSYSNDEITANIICSTARIAQRVVVVSTSDIKDIIHKAGLKISDFCTLEKEGKSKFERKIWVCEK
ncbi:TRM11 family SAM-dependent methyltransferase [Plebeiibacterium marinum]|uniref:Methyltransferase n=1 Tax=Plebeiibacterium marinum TaxID=2992111 RepID=A0AAE3MG17_9BACT|nr:methyltransferase [Plebeiobacterium marinum]MCW3807109.1 methyltransferase [Plebeiobacterium marinum]